MHVRGNNEGKKKDSERGDTDTAREIGVNSNKITTLL